MTTQDTAQTVISPVSALNTVQEVQRVNQESDTPAQRDLDFLSYLSAPVMAELPLPEPLSAPQSTQADSKPAEMVKKKEKEAASKLPEADTATPTISAAIKFKDTDDINAKDMISLGTAQLHWNDLTALQALPTAANMQHFVLQNFSPSLIDTMPNLHYTSLGVSSGLKDVLDTAYKTQRPVRIALSDDAAMILRLGRDGRVSAEFLPSNQVAEAYFRQHLLELRSRLDEKQLPYDLLSVRNWQENPDQRDEQDKRQQQ